jgi:tetratricopeptide (TPR) repeat protein
MMGSPEWFRRTTWTDRDATEFEARLARSRGANRKAQYLRIQAVHLFETGDASLTRAALGLVDRLISEFPDPFQLAPALSLRAEALVDLGEPEEALETYGRALEARRAFPQVGDDGYVGFAELVLALRRRELYDAALAALDEFADRVQFPIEEFRIAACRALIAAERGAPTDARRWAREALAAAAKSESPFRYHRKLGLVRGVDPVAFQRRKSLAA